MRLQNGKAGRQNKAGETAVCAASHRGILQGNIREIEAEMVIDELGVLRQRLSADRDGFLTQTRARLTRLARARGVAPDMVDDVAQETLLEAWRSLGRLTSPSGFSAWIDEICRNICHRVAHRRASEAGRLAPMPLVMSGQDAEDDAIDWLVSHHQALSSDDPMADLIEDLSRQDLVTLLDRALDALPIETRKLVEMCHLQGLPHAEVAAQLGITSGTLDTRLSRARRQLHQALNGPLRREAAAFGLAMDEEGAEAWQETRLWCPNCARNRLQGAFMPFKGADGGPNLHLRCPECASRYRRDATHTMSLIPLAGLRSFRPAWKRSMQGLSDYMARALQSGQDTCWNCGKPASLAVADARGAGSLPFHIETRCASCGQVEDLSGAFPSIDQIVYWSHPLTRQFILEHDRWRSAFGAPVERDGALAIPLTLSDIDGGKQLTILAERQTLRVVALA